MQHFLNQRMHRVGRREGRGVGMSHICEFVCLCMSIHVCVHVRTYVHTMYMYVCVHMHCLLLPSEDGFADSVPTCHSNRLDKGPTHTLLHVLQPHSQAMVWGWGNEATCAATTPSTKLPEPSQLSGLCSHYS